MSFVLNPFLRSSQRVQFSLKLQELRVWLLDKGIYFDDLDGDEQRTWFKKFVVAWNAKDLDSKSISRYHICVNEQSLKRNVLILTFEFCRQILQGH
jgi:hypothetical protein